MRESVDRGSPCISAILTMWCLGLLALAAFSQSTTQRSSEVQIIVTDQAGAVIPDAEIIFKGHEIVNGRTAQDGTVHLNLPFDQYAVTVSHPGFKTRQIVMFPVETATHYTLPLVLDLGGIYDPVELNLDKVLISSELPNPPVANEAIQMPNRRVDVKTDKADYLVGEPIYITTTLTNVGNSVVYIAKTFLASGGGIAGFDVRVSQLTGKRTEHGCNVAGDRFCLREARTPKQILQEDFLRLAPGVIVGYRFLYTGCVVAHSGTYEMTSTYRASDCNTELVRSLPEYANQIVTGNLVSKSWLFHVREGRPSKGR